MKVSIDWAIFKRSDGLLSKTTIFYPTTITTLSNNIPRQSTPCRGKGKTSSVSELQASAILKRQRSSSEAIFKRSDLQGDGRWAIGNGRWAMGDGRPIGLRPSNSEASNSQ